MNTEIEIIIRKKNGIDCTEAESAEIKGFIRELFNVGITHHEVIKLFPIEYSEVFYEYYPKVRKPMYENKECEAVGLCATCNCCDRIIFEDENDLVEYIEDGRGYCKECRM